MAQGASWVDASVAASSSASVTPTLSSPFNVTGGGKATNWTVVLIVGAVALAALLYIVGGNARKN